MAALLVSRGVPGERIVLEETGTDTLSSVRAVAALIRRHAIATPVFAASSLYHLPRCLLLLRLTGIPAHAAIPPVVPAGTRWWGAAIGGFARSRQFRMTWHLRSSCACGGGGER